MTDKKDNVIKFPKKLEIPMIWSTGMFGVAVSNIRKVTVHGDTVYMWFWREDNDDNRLWDLAIPCPSPKEAQESYHEFMDMLRRMRFKLLNSELYKSMKGEED